MNVTGRLGHVLAMAAGGLVVWGVAVHGFSPAEPPAVTPVQVVAAPVPASAYECAVKCPGYVAPDESYHDKPSYVQGPIPTNGVVTVYLPAPTAQGTPATTAKTSKAKASQPRQAKAQAAPKQTAQPKQSQASTTTTTKDSTTTTAKGTTTTTHTTTTTQKG